MKLFVWGATAISKNFKLKACPLNRIFDDYLKTFYLDGEFYFYERAKLVAPRDGAYTILYFDGDAIDGDYEATLISPLRYKVKRIN